MIKQTLSYLKLILIMVIRNNMLIGKKNLDALVESIY